MEVSVRDAKAQIPDLVRRAEAGGEAILTRFGKAVVRPMPVAPPTTAGAREAVLDAVRASGRAAASSGPEAARSQDSLHVEDGLPR